MDFPFRSTGCVKRSKEYWNKTPAISASTPAAKTKKKAAGVSPKRSAGWSIWG
jgi:hypothetical protein